VFSKARRSVCSTTRGHRFAHRRHRFARTDRDRDPGALGAPLFQFAPVTVKMEEREERGPRTGQRRVQADGAGAAMRRHERQLAGCATSVRLPLVGACPGAIAGCRTPAGPRPRARLGADLAAAPSSLSIACGAPVGGRRARRRQHRRVGACNAVQTRGRAGSARSLRSRVLFRWRCGGLGRRRRAAPATDCRDAQGARGHGRRGAARRASGAGGIAARTGVHGKF